VLRQPFGLRWFLRAAVVAPLLAVPLVIGGIARSRTHYAVAESARSPPRSAVNSSARGQYSVSIQAVFDLAGNPSLVANFSPDGSLAVPEWSICRPPEVSVCSPAVRTAHAILSPEPEPAGTVFRASARYGGRIYSAAVIWRGRVQIFSRPRLRGRADVGAAVTPVAGLWGGGWGTEFDQLAVEACPTTRARSCVMLSGGQLSMRRFDQRRGPGVLPSRSHDDHGHNAGWRSARSPDAGTPARVRQRRRGSDYRRQIRASLAAPDGPTVCRSGLPAARCRLMQPGRARARFGFAHHVRWTFDQCDRAISLDRCRCGNPTRGSDRCPGG